MVDCLLTAAQRQPARTTAAYASLSHDSLVKELHHTDAPRDNKKPAPGQIPVQIPSQTLGKNTKTALTHPNRPSTPSMNPIYAPPIPPSTPQIAIFSTKPKTTPKPEKIRLKPVQPVEWRRSPLPAQ